MNRIVKSSISLLFFTVLHFAANAQLVPDCIDFEDQVISVIDYDPTQASITFGPVEMFTLDDGLLRIQNDIQDNGEVDFWGNNFLEICSNVLFRFNGDYATRIELDYYLFHELILSVNGISSQSFTSADLKRDVQFQLGGAVVIIKPTPNHPDLGKIVIEGNVWTLGFDACEFGIDNLCYEHINSDPCQINNIEVHVNLCDEEQLFYVDLNFYYENVSDSFHLNIASNTSPILSGYYAYADLPVSLGPFDASDALSGTIVDWPIFEIEDADSYANPGQIPCKASIPVYDSTYCDYLCDFDSLTIDSIICLDKDGFNITFNLNHQNAATDSFSVFIANEFQGVFAFDQLPVNLDVYPQTWVGDWIPLTVSNKSYDNHSVLGCQNTAYFQPPCPDCNIDSLVLKVKDNIGIPGAYGVEIDFMHNRHNDDVFLVKLSNNQFTFTYGELPVLLQLDCGHPNDSLLVTVCDSISTNCCLEEYYIAPDCITNCMTDDLQVEIGDCDINSFDLEIYFTPNTNSSGRFIVYYNNTSIGAFNYADLPINISDVPWDGSNNIEISVCDGSNPDCCQEIVLDYPCLGCEIWDLVVEDLPCDSLGFFYYSINFNSTYDHGSNPNLLFYVDVNGISYGQFQYDDRPVQVGPFDSHLDISYDISVYDAQDPNCGANLTHGGADCGGPCPDAEILANIGDCINGHFTLELSFTHDSPSDSFFIKMESTGLGAFNFRRYAYHDLPLAFSYIGSGDVFEYTAFDAADPDCRYELIVQTPRCVNNCSIEVIDAQISDCDSDGMYFVTFDLGHQNTSQEFYVRVDNNTTFGPFAYSQLPVTLGPFVGDGLTSHLFLFNDAVMGNCAADWVTQAVDCDNCELDRLRFDITDCDSLDQFYVWLNFDHFNTSNAFTVQGNGASYGTFAYNALPIKLGPFVGDGTTTREFVITDLINSDCSIWGEIDPVNCDDTCGFTDIRLEPTDCDPNGSFNIEVRFKAVGTNGNDFLIFADGQLFGPYASNTPQPITIGPFYGDGISIYDVLILNVGDPTCYGYDELRAPDCSTPCELERLILQRTPCDNGQFMVNLDLVHHNTGNNGFNVILNGQSLGRFNYNMLPLSLGPFAGDATTLYEFVVFDNQMPNCRIHNTIGPIDCSNAPCSITNLLATPTPCNADGEFFVDIRFQYNNTTSSSFTVRGNGLVHGSFNFTDLPVRVGPFLGDGSTIYEFIVYDNDDLDCQADTIIGTVDCDPNGCQISNVQVKVQDCHDDGTYSLILDFDVQNPGNAFFEVFSPRRLLGYYPLSSLPILIDSFPASGNPLDEIRVCINDIPNCCAQKIFRAPDCFDDCYYFDDVVTDTVFARPRYAPGDTVRIDNIHTELATFIPSILGARFDSVKVEKANIYFDAASNNQVTTYNSALIFDFLPQIISTCLRVELDYFQTGNENNISLNGQNVIIFERFTDLPRMIAPGVRAAVFPVNPREGKLVLQGRIETLRIGGEYLSFDNMCFETCTSTIAVWPGDIDANSRVDHKDLLGIGLAYQTQDLERSIQATDWEGQTAEDWVINFANGANFKHADCNGDGIVDEKDIDAIEENFLSENNQLVTNPFDDLQGLPGAIPLYLTFPPPSDIDTGRPFTGNIILGAEDIISTNTYGIAFSLKYDPTKLNIVDIKYKTSWLGEPGNDLISIDKSQMELGLVHVAIARTNHENVSGFGAIADFIGIIDDIAGKNTTINIDIIDAVAIDKSEFLQRLYTPTNELQVTTSIEELYLDGLSINPNPTFDRVYFEFENPKQINRIQIYSIDGGLIEETNPMNNHISLANLAKGTYFLRIEAGQEVYRKRILKL